MRDKNYIEFSPENSLLKHNLGDNIAILDDIYSFSLLSKLSSIDTEQPYINILLRELYKTLLNKTVSLFFPKAIKKTTTRMFEFDPKGEFEGLVIDPETKVIITDIARAGMIPGQICFDTLNLYLNPKNVIFDHIMASRDISVESGSLNTVLAGMKIAPEFSDGIILIPDPMGATGSSISKVVSMYKKLHKNVQIVTMHLIITPEYVKNITKQHPDIKVVAIRYDRGLSNSDIFNKNIGEDLENEKSLTKDKYIIPGAGGLGEVINNNFV